MLAAALLGGVLRGMLAAAVVVAVGLVLLAVDAHLLDVDDDLVADGGELLELFLGQAGQDLLGDAR